MKEVVFRVRPMPIKEQKHSHNLSSGYKWYAHIPSTSPEFKHMAYKTPATTQKIAISHAELAAKRLGRGEIRVFNKAGKLRQRYIIFTIEQTIRISKKIKR